MPRKRVSKPAAAPTTGTARLLIQCADRPGIVAAVSQFLYQRSANIVQADQYSTDATGGRFFMRMEYSLEGLAASPEDIEVAFGAEVAQRFEMDWRVTYSARPQRVAILVSRYDHCLMELLWRWRRGELDIEVPLVVSNHEALRADVEAFGISFRYVPVTLKTRAEGEAAALKLLESAGVGLVVLARYMQILSPAFISRYPGRVINIHHSFLPAFAGADPYGRAFDRGVKLIGATAHYATDDLDEGPIIEQDVVHISHRDGRDDLVRLGREVERSVLARAVQWHVEDRVFVHANKTVVFR
ncbi:MAG: formyltetrahydrofolate deformylase [Dehalococcoidia bacterium]|nr:formyltetrahydrofolate deformylase [Dehalococcoidia bacterium]